MRTLWGLLSSSVGLFRKEEAPAGPVGASWARKQQSLQTPCLGLGSARTRTRHPVVHGGSGFVGCTPQWSLNSKMSPPMLGPPEGDGDGMGAGGVQQLPFHDCPPDTSKTVPAELTMMKETKLGSVLALGPATPF